MSLKKLAGNVSDLLSSDCLVHIWRLSEMSKMVCALRKLSSFSSILVSLICLLSS